MKKFWIWGPKDLCADSFHVLIHTGHFMRNLGKKRMLRDSRSQCFRHGALGTPIGSPVLNATGLQQERNKMWSSLG